MSNLFVGPLLLSVISTSFLFALDTKFPESRLCVALSLINLYNTIYAIIIFDCFRNKKEGRLSKIRHFIFKTMNHRLMTFFSKSVHS
jgi:hypothetical protein